MTANSESNDSVYKLVLGLVFLTAVAAVLAGCLIWLKQGFTENAMVFITCGGITLIFIFVGMVLPRMLISRELPSPDNPQPYDDPPPTYRNTWRLEYIVKNPFHLKKSRDKRFTSKRDVRSIWNSSEVRVHRDMTMDENVYNTNEIPAGGHLSSTHSFSEGRNSSLFISPLETGSSERPERNNTLDFYNIQPPSLQGISRGNYSLIALSATATVHHTFDEGLPSYEDVQGSDHPGMVL